MVPLKRVANVIAGQSPSSDDVMPLGGGTPFLQGNAEFGQDNPNPKFECNVASKHCDAGDILLSVRAPVGSLNIADRRYAIGRGLCAIRSVNVDQRYLWWWANTQDVFLNAVATGSTYAAVTAEQVGSLCVPDISLGEQRRVADFLDAEVSWIDRLLELTRRQALLSVEGFAELMRASTSTGIGGVRSTGVPWMPEMNSSWDLMKVSRNFLVGGGTTPAASREDYFSGPYPWVNSADIKDGDIVSTEKQVSLGALTDYPSLSIHPAGSLVVALYGQGATKGRVGILRVDACMNQACCALRPSGGLLADYAYFWFRGHKDGLIGLAVGAGQPNLSQEIIKGVRIPAPDLREQGRIVAGLREAEVEFMRRKELLGRREELLEERKRALITAAVTGQIDITTARGADLS